MVFFEELELEDILVCWFLNKYFSINWFLIIFFIILINILVRKRCYIYKMKFLEIRRMKKIYNY